MLSFFFVGVLTSMQEYASCIVAALIYILGAVQYVLKHQRYGRV